MALPHVTPLEIIRDGLEHDAALSEAGRAFTDRFLGRLVEGAAAIDAAFEADPTLTDERIVAPIFVIGPPRTGTTALHRLLGSHRRHRVPQGWEFLYPTRPDDPDVIAAAAEELGWPQERETAIRSIHTYDARMPKECLSAMSFSFRSEEFVSRYRLPTYVTYLAGCDMQPAYDMHRRVLQLLQRRSPTERWVLKSPVHLQSIPELVATYPDASFVVTHRDPVRVLGSVSSLIATLRRAFSDTVDPVEIGRYHLELYDHSLDRLVDHVDGVLPTDRTVHVRHVDLLRDPVGTIATVYDRLDVEADDGVAEGAANTAGAEREDGAGSHHYDLADYGLDAGEIAERFVRYSNRFLADG
ncbi:MAG: sulfotransferase [Actinomycetota bacterium]